MPFSGSSHLIGLEPSTGPRVGFFEAIEQGYEQQYRVDSPYSLEAEIQERWEQSLLSLERETGEAINLEGGLGAYQYYARSVLGQDQTFFAKSLDGEVAPATLQSIASFQRANDRIKQLGRPDVKSFEQVLQEAMAAQQRVEARTADVSERGGVAAMIGQFIGAVGGTFSERDPVSLATLGIGGFGRTAAMRIATEAGIAGGFAGATELGAVQPSRELAGLPERSAVFDIAAAAVGAGAIRGGLEGLSALAGRFGREARPAIALDFDDAQLRSMFEANQQMPAARAGESILDEVQALERANPYGDGAAAEARFLAELADVQKAMGGEVSTAIARVLPPLPEEYIAKQADFQIVKEQSPAVWTRFEEAQAAVRSIDERATEISEALEATTLPDAVRLVDPEAADELDNLARVVNDESLPEPVREAADIRAQSIITRVDEERIAKALNDREIAPRKEIQRLRASRKAANKRLRVATREVEAERTKILRNQEIIRGLQQRESVDLLGNSMGGRPFLMPELNHERVKVHLKQIDDVVEQADDRALAATKAEFDEDGTVDIGLRERVAADFVVPIEQADGSVREMSVKEIFDEFAEDEALEEAVKACAI
jgi:hypothetical protein